MRHLFRSLSALVVLGVLVVIVFLALPRAERLGVAGDREGGNRLVVATTIHPVFDMVREVAGERAEVLRVLPPGASPHTFELTPRGAQDLSRAEVLFVVGHGLDDWAVRAARDVAGLSAGQVVTLDRGINLLTGSEPEAEEEDREEGTDEKEGEEDGHDRGHLLGETDPHYWLSLENARAMVETIRDTLTEHDPAGAELYTARAARYREELAGLEAEIKATLADLKSDQVPPVSIITLHDSWRYFAREFGFSIAGVFEPAPGREPGPRYLAELSEMVEREGVRVIFIEPQLSGTAIAAFAADYDLSVAVLDPLGGLSGREGYLDLMRYNADQVVQSVRAGAEATVTE